MTYHARALALAFALIMVAMLVYYGFLGGLDGPKIDCADPAHVGIPHCSR